MWADSVELNPLVTRPSAAPSMRPLDWVVDWSWARSGRRRATGALPCLPLVCLEVARCALVERPVKVPLPPWGMPLKQSRSRMAILGPAVNTI
ncbi:hypothetical protein BS50DRAFT_62171 [Corynespora cassiicola Philippines]|uniref:Uncharacterized protein n=1 Tax=Corynespora cassiicola Philippines TaxID=1448308 RepID=A0A2T2NKK2_CORCC|nr:hypothetical protein BS50DRAFT_62171 [Corynespora cassiicola Philippines]